MLNGPAADAATCNGQWQLQDGVLDPDFTPYQVDAVNANNVFVAGRTTGETGDQATLTKWNGGSWTAIPVPDMSAAYDVKALSGKDVYVTGVDDTFTDVIRRYDGTKWSDIPSTAEVFGEYGGINKVVPKGPSDIWAFGVRFNSNGGVPIVAHYDGTAWKAVPNNLAGTSWAVPADASVSPSGELWVIGEDIVNFGETRKPWAGKLVNGAFKRVELPSVPGQQSTFATSLSWKGDGSMLLTGYAGSDARATFYPFSAEGTPGSMKLRAMQAPVAAWTEPTATAKVGSTFWSAASALLMFDEQWNSVTSLGTNGWGAPQQLNLHQGERAISMDGIGNGQGWMATWKESREGTTPRMWTICGTPTTAPAAAAPTTASKDSAATKPAPRVELLSPKASPAERMKAVNSARQDGRQNGFDGTTTLKSSGRAAAQAAGREAPVAGPVIDKLRASQKSAATTSFVAKDVCSPAASGYRCASKVVAAKPTAGTSTAAVSTVPFGYGPTELRAAYGLPATGGKGRTIAIIGGLGYPALEKDLAQYRKTAGLKACTTASGCLTIVGEDGGTPTTEVDDGWALEQALDAQAASAVCPDCKILVVQASSLSDEGFGTANQQAAKMGAFVINNSFSRQELLSDTETAKTFVPQGVPLTASSGDSGHGTAFPSSAPAAIGVGGTRLLESPGTPRGWREDTWTDSGGGCSAVQPKPAWEQKDALCTDDKASVVDVSAVGDPSTGVGVYFAQGLYGESGGWYVMGGTSLSAPVTAGIIALRGAKVSSETIWNGSTASLDIAGGVTNGWCAPARECKAVKGYDGATGWGVVKP